MSRKINYRKQTRATQVQALAGRAVCVSRAIRQRALAPSVALGLAALLGGCNAQSFLDPSVAGRWEPTPTIMPILDRIAAIEDDTGQMVDISDPVPGDLIPLPVSYRIGPGDQLDVTLYDLIETNRPELYQVVVDARGAIELPQLGRIVVMNLTTEEATDVLKTAMKRLVAEPLVLVVAKAQRQQTFNIIGAVESPGPYFIPRADYRLLEALTAGGRLDESLEEVFIIRQVPLSEDVTKGQGAPEPGVPSAPAGEKPKDLNSVIDTIAPPAEKPATPTNPPAAPPAETPKSDTPKEPAPAPAIPLPGEPAAAPTPAPSTPAPQAEAPKDNQPKPPPVIDLPDQSRPAGTPTPRGTPPKPADEGGGWIFVNGKWVQAGRAGQAEQGRQTPPTQDLITQRIIRVPLKPLLQGKQTYNIVVRPGDVVRVPQPPSGLVYMSGQLARPGPYQLPGAGGLTMMRAIDAAGGLGSLAIPERIELTRILDHNREATIMLDGRAIAERTEPDVYLKPNDRINVGTNFWALPLAVIRNGFRASYGFGFVLDRNISNDIFGPPPVNQFGQ